ncbi:MAG: hypothetical protein HC886_07680 [Leptolyngbyaceae cyanobacterium SM1_1_3]|nr:hypothetical protein [Leptolyngbyaceae cyanobacterium SM1_1_3]NJM85476.1 hypothetical protein [Leptolyngbyaceae cyanobacterium RM2_2_21]NJN03777.1 hypothetical protein [Leptolyngbyaceae cyanobacterium RM1_1_2]NJO10152.1 hypothetical protein [Leptolyngbyaceae cyanobacterium SL_1_1]
MNGLSKIAQGLTRVLAIALIGIITLLALPDSSLAGDLASGTLVAGRELKLIYPDASGEKTKYDIGDVSQEELKRQATQIPAQGQEVLDRSDPNANILEKVGEAFSKAGAFIGNEANRGPNRAGDALPPE